MPWAEHDARFTRAFEEQAAWLAVECSKTTLAELMRVSWQSVGWILVRVARRRLAGQERLKGQRRIGIDEIIFREGQRYLVIVATAIASGWSRPLRATTRATVDCFFFMSSDPGAISSPPRHRRRRALDRQVVVLAVPQTTRCLDRFPVVVWAPHALDQMTPGLE